MLLAAETQTPFMQVSLKLTPFECDTFHAGALNTLNAAKFWQAICKMADDIEIIARNHW